MSLPIVEEKDVQLRKQEQECCCFCREKTRWWTDMPERKPGEQVACCPKCAKVATPEDLPTKEAWCRRERIARGRTFI